MNVNLKWYTYFIVMDYLFCVDGERNIGAIFDDGSFLQEATFDIAITAASENEDNAFVANVIRTAPGDIMEAEDAMCSLLKHTIYGVFGPQAINTLQHVQSLADFLEIPQIITEPIVTQTRNWSAINLYPNHNAYSQIFADIITLKGWTEFTIIYEGAELLPFLNNVVSLEDLDSGENVVITVIQLPDGDDYRSQLKTIKTSGSVNYLVNCRIENLLLLLEQAQQVGIMSDEHSYVIMNPDFQTMDISPFKHGGSNITGIRFFDPELKEVKELITSIDKKVKELSEGRIENALEKSGLTLNLALVYDSVMLYSSAIKAMGLKEGANITCEFDKSWNFGSTVINYVRTTEIDGLTGIIKFDEEGFRTELEVDIFEVMAHGFEKFGFTPGCSTTDAGVELLEKIFEAWETSQDALGIFCDLSKAFDCVKHETLNSILKHYGIREKALDLISSYLNERIQKVDVNGKRSHGSFVKMFVPQGSILGPFLFLIYINDLPYFVRDKHGIVLFAIVSLTSLIFKINRQQSVIDDVNNALSDIVQWFNANNLLLNKKKMKYIKFTLPNVKKVETNVQLNNEELDLVNSTVFLGITLDSRLQWGPHIRDLSTRISSAAYAVQRICRLTNVETARLVYFSYFHSIMSYGILLWGNASDIDTIFVLQKRAVRAIYNMSPRESL